MDSLEEVNLFSLVVAVNSILTFFTKRLSVFTTNLHGTTYGFKLVSLLLNQFMIIKKGLKK